MAPQSVTSSQPSSSTLVSPSTALVFPKAYTKHFRFWALDGNILVQIGTIRFRLHRSRLASHSPWFGKLFDKHAGNPLEFDDEDRADIDDVRVETVEGQNVFLLDSTGVKLEDFETLLAAMDDGM
jgi:hypothetical protein